MNWPWVSRARLDAVTDRLNELKADHAELKLVHRRIVDEVNFRSSGFHLYPEFEKRLEPDPPAAPKKENPEVELNTTEKAIQQYGPRIRSVVTAIEQDNLGKFSQQEEKIRDVKLREASEKALHLMEDTLSKTRPA